MIISTLKQIVSHKRFGIWLFLAVFVLSLSVPLATSPLKAHALTPDQVSTCTQFTGPLIYSALSSADQGSYSNCLAIGACMATPQTDKNAPSNSVAVVCQTDSSNPQAILSPLIPVITAVCGAGGGSDAAVSAYQTCSANVIKAYSQCEYVGGTPANDKLNSPTNVAKCLVSKFPGTSASKLTAAVTQGQTSATTAAAGPAPATTPPNSAANVDAPTCDNSAGILSWITCPIIEGLAKAIDGIYGGVIQPMLQTYPLSLDTNDGNYKVWSTFRIIGDVLLVVALMVIVFGQSLGGGLIDAYSAKKILPRLLVAAILINISYYLMALAVDVTNIIGGGLQNLILAPFATNGVGIRVGNGASGIGLAAIVGVAGTIWAASTVVTGALITTLLSGILVPFLLFILLPAFLTILGILGIVIFRQGLIVFLVLSSPVAFALYCLPNTEHYFKKWWDLTLKTLMVYPIMSVLFALSNVFAITVTNTTGHAFGGPLKALISIIALFVPLFLIPFAFKIAGGVLGRLHEVTSGLGKRGVEAVKGNPNNPLSLRNRMRSNSANAFNRAGAQSYRNYKGRGGSSKIAAFALGSTLEREAIQKSQAAQRMGTVRENGDDSILNAAASFEEWDAKKGKMVRKTLDGKEVNALDYEAARQQYPTQSDRQYVADYRSTKLNSSEDAEMFTRNFAKMSKQNGMTLEETAGAFTGLAFARQNERGEWKHGNWSQDAAGDYQFTPVGAANMYSGTELGEKSKSGAKNFNNEQYHKKGSFDAARALSSQFVALNDVKRQHVGEIKRVEMASSAGTATAADLASRDYAREELRKTLEIQDAWGKNAGGRDPVTGDPIVGISGANSATIAAYNQLISGDEAKGMAPATHEQGIIAGLKSEIAAGNTWEALQNKRPIS